MTEKDHRLARITVGTKGISFSYRRNVLHVYLLLLSSLIYKFHFRGKKLKKATVLK